MQLGSPSSIPTTEPRFMAVLTTMSQRSDPHLVHQYLWNTNQSTNRVLGAEPHPGNLMTHINKFLNA